MPETDIPVGDFSVSASIHGEGATLVALGHGAGGDRRTRFLVQVADALAASGRRALLYNFRYTERGRRAPDPPRVLERTVAAVSAFAVERLDAAHLVLGGKSMGGRIASQAVAKGTRADALVFLGYPLHAPGRTEALRDAHLGDIQAPMLFLQGTRDAFARFDLIEGVARRLGKRATLHRVEAADHSFGVTKRSGRSPAEVEAGILGALVDWLSGQGL